jgi:hypothetical protein
MNPPKEHAVGTVFQYEYVELEVESVGRCRDCYFGKTNCLKNKEWLKIMNCISSTRQDKTSIIYKQKI